MIADGKRMRRRDSAAARKGTVPTHQVFGSSLFVANPSLSRLTSARTDSDRHREMSPC